MPVRGDEPAVATARAAAEDVGLQEDDPQAGIAVEELVGRPQARESAAHDANVGGHPLGELRTGSSRVGGEGLLEPETSSVTRAWNDLRHMVGAA